MKLNKLSMLLALSFTTLTLTACGHDALKEEMVDAQNSGKDIQIHTDIQYKDVEKEDLVWTELDQLDTYRTIRRTIDDKADVIIFDNGSKNGVLYVDENGSWAGNNTLYNALQNKAFVEQKDKYWTDGKFRSEVSKKAIEEFKDIDNESMGFVAAINAYWNILPANKDKTSGLSNVLSRAEAMTAIYRGDTPVTYNELNEEFLSAVGYNEYTEYAYNLTDVSYLDYKNGSLNYSTFNSPITKAEVIYILVNRYWPDEYASVGDDVVVNLPNTPKANNKSLDELKGNHGWQAYTLDYCIQTNSGCPIDLYKALYVANKHGIIDNQFDWDSQVVGGWLLNTMISTYSNIYNNTSVKVNAKLGENAGQSLITIKHDDKQPEKTEVLIGGENISSVRDISDIDDLLKVYGNEVEMTEEELNEVKDNVDGYTFTPVDKWMEVAYCRGLNIRTGPSTNYKIIGCVPSGTKAHIVAVCNENGWYRIITEGKIVYQCGNYFRDFEGSENYKFGE